MLHGAIEAEQGAPPAAPADGQSWLVGTGASGAWLGQTGKIAARQSGNWLFVTPRDGVKVLNRTSGQEMRYFAGWKVAARPALPNGGKVVDTEARNTITTILAVLTTAGIVPAT